MRQDVDTHGWQFVKSPTTTGGITMWLLNLILLVLLGVLGIASWLKSTQPKLGHRPAAAVDLRDRSFQLRARNDADRAGGRAGDHRAVADPRVADAEDA